MTHDESDSPFTGFSHTAGPWVFSRFCKADGNPIETTQDVKDAMSASTEHSDRAELWGVTATNADGETVIVCYTGNGPTSENNARCLTIFPDVIAGYEKLLQHRDRLLAACRQALHLAEENAEAIAKMEGGFGIHWKLKDAIDGTERTASPVGPGEDKTGI